MPGMPFNQMILFPVTLTLHTTDAGLRMYTTPIREIAKLHRGKRQWQDHALKSGETLSVATGAELLHIEAELGVGDCETCGFMVRGVPVTYNAKKQELACLDKTAPLQMVDGKIALELIVDRTSIEIFGNHGRMYMPMGVQLADKPKSVSIFTTGGDTKIKSLNVHELESIWP
jgi:sucrose-6-phosphate hydrolase SacC (GH32 family)